MTASPPIDNLRVLYVVYWGAHEPLGQSLVLPFVRRLAALGAHVVLITYEKDTHLSQVAVHRALRAELEAAGIVWRPLRYHKWPKWPATAFDLVQGFVAGYAAGRRSRVQIVHARTFVGGVLGLGLRSALRAKLVYHNEGFYPDEQVDGGFWRAGSLPHRIALWFEGRLYRTADGIIALSTRARDAIRRLPGTVEQAITVVPSCVDLDRFVREPRRASSTGSLGLVYVGSVGGRYRLDWAGEFVSTLTRWVSGARLRILSHADPALIESEMTKSGLPRRCWTSAGVSHRDIATELTAQDAGLFFLTSGLSEHGCSPTKIGEYWAAGLPVVTTANIGDVEAIVEENRVGVVVRGDSPTDYETAARELMQLIEDPGTPARCRDAADRFYSLEKACARQLALYAALTPYGGSGRGAKLPAGARTGDPS